MSKLKFTGPGAGIQLVITTALQKEMPKKWLESHNIPVHSLAALKSGALSRLNNSHKGILAVVTGAGMNASEEAALWINKHLTPLYVMNIGTCGLLDNKLNLSRWIKPRYISNEDGNRIRLDSRLPIPPPTEVLNVHSLISVMNANTNTVTEQWKQNDAVDMECFAQAKVFENSDTSFHCLKYATDFSDQNTSDDFNKNIIHFQDEYQNLFSFISDDCRSITSIIPVHNREQTVRHAIDSVLSQSSLPEEIIVVDDCSTDRTREILESYGDKITRVYLPENAGPSKARNEGVKLVQTEWIAFLDSDDSWEKNKLKSQIEYLRKYPFYQILQSEEKWIRNGVRVNPCKHHQKPEGWIFDQSLQRCLISPSSALLKKSIFDQYGGFDEDLPVCEDYDLWLKISRHHPVGLERGLNINKYGGHDDQLSTKYPAMDKFRVKALTSLLKNEPEPEYIDKITHVLKIKLNILIQGYDKRNNSTDANKYRAILSKISSLHNS